ncbi:MAG: hypothetical protein ACI9JD_003941, partial [Rhodococcus sp. (in: high G+C Gram-positive bacteria)]
MAPSVRPNSDRTDVKFAVGVRLWISHKLGINPCAPF